MQIYLLKDLPEKKAKAGEIINVNDGYGKNFLIKNKIGVLADSSIIAKVKAKAQSDDFHTQQEKQRIREVIARLSDAEVIIKAKVGDGKLFGSVTGGEIATELKSMGFEIEKRDILMAEPIKSLGTYKLRIKFAHSLEGVVTVSVISG